MDTISRRLHGSELRNAIAELTGVHFSMGEVVDVQHEVLRESGWKYPERWDAAERTAHTRRLLIEQDAVLADVHAGLAEGRYTPAGERWTEQDLGALFKSRFIALRRAAAPP